MRESARKAETSTQRATYQKLPQFRPSRATKLWASIADRIDRTTGWSHLPALTGALVIGGLRTRLRQSNLYDTSELPAIKRPASLESHGLRHLTARTADGSFNDLNHPEMGRANTRFGRNVPLDTTRLGDDQRLLWPNPRTVSRRLLTREQFIPAASLNLLAAAWLQFNVHDWISHGTNQKDDPWRIELATDDPFPHHPMTILRTRRDATAPRDTDLPTFTNVATHWWDVSQLYGSDEKTQLLVREGAAGKLKLDDANLLPLGPDGLEVTGVNGNWWLGLDLMHTLFTLEHNAICDRLKREYPGWSDQELFDRARLVIAALIAKIHTVEWTPGILGHPALQVAMRANWYGLAGQAVDRVAGRVSSSEVISGIPGSPTDHFGVPYSMTEEFVAVYRMHPLLRDDHEFRSFEDDGLIERRDLQGVAFRNARPALNAVGMQNALYSFGLMNPGAITLHNFPRGMQQLVELDGTITDLAALDLVRTRERGVPRYNEFRTLMHKAPLKSFDQLSDNPRWVEQLREVYQNDLDAVDLMVGLFAEPVPQGFGFSDTAFRVFILMASRRLNSDRFFTKDFTPEVYTPAGMQWVDDNGFASVLLRHFPALRPALRGVPNPFAPWHAVGSQ